jgi:hypothetical protein
MDVYICTHTHARTHARTHAHMYVYMYIYSFYGSVYESVYKWLLCVTPDPFITSGHDMLTHLQQIPYTSTAAYCTYLKF